METEDYTLLTDLRPIIERILRTLALAGLPLAVACHGRPVDMGAGGQGGGGVDGIGGSGTGGMGGIDQAAIISCQPFKLSCGSPPVLSCPSFAPDGGSMAHTFAVPIRRNTFGFNPKDPRWEDLYRACVAVDPGPRCGPDCTGLCRVVAEANGLRITDVLECELTCETANKLTIGAAENYVCGRRPGTYGSPSGSQSLASHTHLALGQYLAECAVLEAASVPAFERLAADLAVHGAPHDLRQAARAARVDEARHWRRTREVARHHGCNPVRPTVVSTPMFSLADMAIDNVIEGCVRETYGAMVAVFQAANARDPEVKHLAQEIAGDEINHAALAWQVDAWATERLGPGFLAQRRAAALRAVREIALASHAGVSTELQEDAGLPGPEDAQALLAMAWTDLWQPAFGQQAPS